MSGLAGLMSPLFLLLACLAGGGLAGWGVARVSLWLPAAMESAWRDDDASDPAVAVPPRLFHGLTALVCALAFGALGLRLGVSGALPAVMVATVALMTLAIIDWNHHLLPDVIVYPLLALGLLVNALGVLIPLQDAMTGAVVGYGSLWIVSRAYRLVFKVTGMGDGDLKLFAALGAWLGWQALLPLALAAAVMAVACSLGCRFLRGDRRTADSLLPYGSYLAVAGWILLAGGGLEQ
ncbi:prepilin peptidase [Insolitispirillum peregrinum]|uniref:Leader peptidase (Prepilin peptidase) / N-methyltransferase n=1 Tax=Insolitispirillum peregrinum TaxID=80876 RepID=A0A1N7QCS4_9PROT|nr:A24 family peptidase [Insolitispirillum peregrinum]SIT20671.1 leader peptidase (prepilin peptidase) / N-methyltransferase [Insolitispirillum peregrinum]